METNNYTNQNSENRDKKLWKLAAQRARFKSHLATYVVMNTFFWILWFFTSRNHGHYGLPWPVWPMIGWGIGLAFHYVRAYVNPEANSVEREYEKLKREEQNK